MNKQRLLDVARACREAPNPAGFTMERFANDCGTPACALGHYACRPDLQDKFSLRNMTVYGRPWLAFEGNVSSYDRRGVLDWFGIDEDESEELFGVLGCGGTEEEDEDGEPVDCPVKDPIAAALYIEAFVARNG